MLAYTILGVVLSGLIHATAANNQRHVLRRESARNLEKKCNWKQLGKTFKGEEEEDKPGSAVALSNDGNVVAYGAFNNNEGAGSVRVYKWNECEWKRRGDKVIRGAASDNLGSDVSISGDGSLVAVGAMKAHDQKGYVAVYKFVENEKKGEWTLCGSITGENKYDLGAKNTVSLSNDGGRVAFRGRTKVQVWNVKVDGDTCDMEPLGVLDTSNKVGKRSVAISGDGTKVAVGTATGPITGDKEGHGIVEVFKYEGEAWKKYGENIYGETKGDYSGAAVSLSLDGSVLAIGAIYHGNTAVGHVRVYTMKINGWIQRGGNIDGANKNDYSGGSISISDDGNSVAIGSTLNDASGNQAGHVRVYKYELEELGWSQIGEDIEGEGPCARLGDSVSISGDGSKVAIGAPGDDCDVPGKPKGYVNIMKVESCEDDSKIMRSKSAKCTTKSPKATRNTKKTKAPKA